MHLPTGSVGSYAEVPVPVCPRVPPHLECVYNPPLWTRNGQLALSQIIKK